MNNSNDSWLMRSTLRATDRGEERVEKGSKTPLLEFDSPPSPPLHAGGNGLPALVYFWENKAKSRGDSKKDEITLVAVE
jgi:hypothetical protein